MLGSLILLVLTASVYVLVGWYLVRHRGPLEATSSTALLSLGVAAATVVVLGDRIDRLSDRTVFGRIEPLDALIDFARTASASYADEAVLAEVIAAVAQATGADYAAIWLEEGDGSDPVTWYPRPHEPSSDRSELDLVVPVEVEGSMVGVIGVRVPSDSAISPAERQLIVDLAAHVGFALRNLQLTRALASHVEEAARYARLIRAARSRLVKLHDRERHRIERGIHDGAQPLLVVAGTKLEVAERTARKDAERAEVLVREAQDMIVEARRLMREIADGIYPQALQRLGMARALEHLVRSASVEVVVVDDRSAPASRELEEVLYLICCEAIQNALKHSRASTINARLSDGTDGVEFEVVDDGVGLVQATGQGTGIESMRERVAAYGGSLEIGPARFGGTRVAGWVPTLEAVEP